MASLGISSLVKYLTSLFFHSIRVTKLCGLFLCRKSKPRTEKLTKIKKECSNLAEKLIKSWPRVGWNLLSETGINRTKDMLNKVKMTLGS